MSTQQPKNTKPPTTDEVRDHVRGIWAFIVSLINLKPGLDKRGTIQNIKNNKKMEGANAWLLMSSIMIASIGLDQNSQAVIIGAMLISPLMSPILGIGLAIGINDRSTLFISLQHFGIAIAIALVTSTIYFMLTPFGEATEQILSRTKPTALDVGVAFFGGLAGIISGSRKDKSNAIPGVAIATALMPPLCVTGYGIANGNYSIMLNSFYLFFLNSVFVALATYLIVRFLNFPVKEFINEKEKQKTTLVIAVISISIIIPSLLIGAGVLQEVREKRNINAFMGEYFKEKEKYIDSYDVIRGDSINYLIVKMYMPIDSSEFTKYEEGLEKFNLSDFKIDILTTSDIDPGKISKLEAEVSDVKDKARQLEEIKKIRSEEEKRILTLRSQLDSIIADTFPYNIVSTEAKVLFPDLEKVIIADKSHTTDFKTDVDIPLVVVKWRRGKYQSAMARDESKLTDWMKMRVGIDTLDLVRIK